MRLANDKVVTRGERATALAKADKIKHKHLKERSKSRRDGRERETMNIFVGGEWVAREGKRQPEKKQDDLDMGKDGWPAIWPSDPFSI